MAACLQLGGMPQRGWLRSEYEFMRIVWPGALAIAFTSGSLVLSGAQAHTVIRDIGRRHCAEPASGLWVLHRDLLWMWCTDLAALDQLMTGTGHCAWRGIADKDPGREYCRWYAPHRGIGKGACLVARPTGGLVVYAGHDSGDAGIWQQLDLLLCDVRTGALGLAEEVVP